MARPLTPEEVELVEVLKLERERYYELAKVKRKQMLVAFKKYTKMLSAHDHFVNEHDKIDRKLFLLTPGITFLKAQKRKERAEVKKQAKKPVAKMTIADALGGSDIESKLKAMIAEKKRKAQLENKNTSDGK